MWRISELWAVLVDVCLFGDVLGHAVALWHVLTGSVKPDDRVDVGLTEAE